MTQLSLENQFSIELPFTRDDLTFLCRDPLVCANKAQTFVGGWGV